MKERKHALQHIHDTIIWCECGYATNQGLTLVEAIEQFNRHIERNDNDATGFECPSNT